MSDLYIKAVAPSVSRSTATLMKTGQTTSYRTGDDGDLEAGRATSFFILAENNPFGNTNRFTDELGGSTYTNNWVIDWSTYNGTNVLGYFRTLQGFKTWDNAIDSSLGTFGTFSGCRNANVLEIVNIINFEYASAGNFSPFSWGLNGEFWSSNTYASNTTLAFHSLNTNNIRTALKSGVSYRNLPVRTFTVTGTTLS